MAKRISVLVALDGADEGLKRAITSAERSLGELSTAAKTSGAKAAAGIAEVKAGMSAFGEQVDRARTPLLAFVTLNWAGGKVQEIVQVADAWNMMSARLKLATAGQREYTVAQKELFAIAQRIGVPIQETATLYGKLQQAVRMLGGEQKDALSITESISQALRLSGASATEAQSSLLQFGQALASGVLRGEEFNSVVENSPRLAQALDGLLQSALITGAQIGVIAFVRQRTDQVHLTQIQEEPRAARFSAVLFICIGALHAPSIHPCLGVGHVFPGNASRHFADGTLPPG